MTALKMWHGTCGTAWQRLMSRRPIWSMEVDRERFWCLKSNSAPDGPRGRAIARSLSLGTTWPHWKDSTGCCGNSCAFRESIGASVPDARITACASLITCKHHEVVCLQFELLKKDSCKYSRKGFNTTVCVPGVEAASRFWCDFVVLRQFAVSAATWTYFHSLLNERYLGPSRL